MSSLPLCLLPLPLLVMCTVQTGCTSAPRHETVLHHNWRFHLGDPAGAARPDFDRTTWQRIAQE